MYDCTEEVREHIALVNKWMRDFCEILSARAKVHDVSKLTNPTEKAMFDTWVPELKAREFGSDAYKEALAQMGEGLKMHYAANAHHPEHHENGVDGMTLYNLIEMVCDWMAAAEKKDARVDMDYLQNRFNLSPQLRSIIENTFKELDFYTVTHCNVGPLFHKDS